jgi:hypothetical protein
MPSPRADHRGYRPSDIRLYVLALDIAGFGQAFAERGDQERILLGCRAAENADNGPGLLRAHGLRTDD